MMKLIKTYRIRDKDGAVLLTFSIPEWLNPKEIEEVK